MWNMFKKLLWVSSFASRVAIAIRESRMLLSWSSGVWVCHIRKSSGKCSSVGWNWKKIQGVGNFKITQYDPASVKARHIIYFASTLDVFMVRPNDTYFLILLICPFLLLLWSQHWQGQRTDFPKKLPKWHYPQWSMYLFPRPGFISI